MLVLSRLLIVVLAALALAMPAAGQDGGAQEAEAAQHGDAASDGAGDHGGDAADSADGHGGKGDYEKHGVIGTLAQGTVAGLAAIVVFLVVLGILATQVWPKIAAGLDEREKKIRDEIEAAEAARQQAKDALDQYERSLAEARSEAQQMLEQTKAEQQKLAAELRAKSEVELQGLKEKAQRDIESARRAAVSELYAEAADLATAVAGKILGREVTTQDRQRLVDEAVAELSGSASRN